MNENKVYILYHGNCFDGFGAAYSAWKKFGDKALYFPCVYGSSLPDIPTDSEVYMIDYSTDRETMLKLYDRCNGKLVVLDHHKTAEQALSGLTFAKFDMNKSGAMLAWEFFNPEKPVPLLISYIQDRDLWRHELPDSKEVSAALQAYPYDFNVWDRLRVHELATEGKTLLRYQEVLVKMICDKSEMLTIDNYSVAVVNATSHWSEIGNYLLKKYPQVDYAASYFTEGKQKKWSLRSRLGFDVSVIAKQHGGGGHAQAAGYVENL